MEYYELHPETPQLRYIKKAIDILEKSGVIIYPTDTVYGLGCNIFDNTALKKLYQIKNETTDKLYSFIIPDLKNISLYARVSDFAFKIIKRCTPGPYTFVLTASKDIPKKLITKRKTVGIRIPNHAIAQTLVRELGHPIISTSVTNRRGNVIYNPIEIQALFNSQVDLMLATGALNGEPSTIVDLSNDSIEIIREGAGDLSLLY